MQLEMLQHFLVVMTVMTSSSQTHNAFLVFFPKGILKDKHLLYKQISGDNKK